MKKLLLALLFFTPAILLAQNSFEGTWRFNPQNVEIGGNPDTFSLQNGIYRCDSCVPKIDIKADGKDHQVSGSPYFDTISVKAVDDHTFEAVRKKNGKVVGTAKQSALDDGKTLNTEWSFVSESGQRGTGKYTSTRVAAAPAGANKASGSWRPNKIESASENVMTVTFKVAEDGLSMKDGVGASYTAKFDGKDYPYNGDPGTTSVSLKKIDENTIEETDKRNGKVINVARMTVSADGRTMTVQGEDKLQGTTYKWEAVKR